MEVSTAMAATLLKAFVKGGTPVMLWGKPGIGKTAIVKQVAEELGYELATFCLGQYDRVDLLGVPTIQDGATVWNPPDTLPRVVKGKKSKGGILFLDEINVAPLSVQAAAYQLIQEGRVGSYSLPPNWQRVAAGNNLSDKAAALRMSSALANRMAHIQVGVNYESWCEWATNAGIAPEVVAFIKRFPQHLHVHAPEANAFPSPRTWEQVGKYLTLDKGVRGLAIASILGDGVATEFCSFLNALLSELPSLENILSDPSNCHMPKKADQKVALVTALSKWRQAQGAQVDVRHADNVIKYITRLGSDYLTTYQSLIDISERS